MSYAYRSVWLFQDLGNVFTALFANLHKEHKKSMENSLNYYDALATILLDKRGAEMFPRDEEFERAFLNKNMYAFKDSFYLLYSLEKFNNKELIEADLLTREHIMPQNLTKEWAVALGENAKEVHERYLHTIGNLTLTGYNQTLSDKNFQKKREIFKTSGIRLNQYFNGVEEWNEETMNKRAKELLNIALNIWKLPKIEEMNQQNLYLLSDTFDPTGKKVYQVSIENNNLLVDSWKGALKKVLEYFLNKDSTIFHEFVISQNHTNGKKLFADLEQTLNNPIQIQNLNIDINYNTNEVVGVLKLIVKTYQIDFGQVKLYIK